MSTPREKLGGKKLPAKAKKAEPEKRPGRQRQ